MNVAFQDVEFPIRFRPGRPMTDEELFRFCQENQMLRVERNADGEVILMSPTGLEGDGANAEIIAELIIWARQDGRGKSFGSNGGFTLADGSMLSPDAAWMLLERWNALEPHEKKRFGHVCPQFVIELRSESDRLPDLRKKLTTWIANGVELGWLVDPGRKVVEVYRSGGEAEVHENPSSVQGTGCIAGFELVMERVWG
jgi:Uma2 family endonuclease